jgi:DNA invertase Pin-like site-specific DNA recombinase
MSTAAHATRVVAKLDTITADLVARQSDSRDENTTSVEDQVAAMLAECERKGWSVGEVHVERNRSGMLPLAKRHGLSRAVERVEAGRTQVLVFAYFDRFQREPAVKDEVVDRVEARGGTVTTLDFGVVTNADPMSWYQGTMISANNKLYALMTGVKTRPTKQRNIDNGVPPFPRITPAYQRREDGTLEQHEINAPFIRTAIEMRLKGDSYTKIARWLSDRLVDVDPDKGRRIVNGKVMISPGGVERMFRSKLMVGEIHFGSFRPNLRAIDKPIMTHSEYRRLQGKRAPRGRYAKSERLLARQEVLRCKTCDSRMTVDTARRGPERKPYTYYRCGNRMCSAPAVVSADVAEAAVWEKAKFFASHLKGSATMAEDVEAARLAKQAAEEALDNAILSLSGLGDRPATKEVLDELQAASDKATTHYDRLASLVTPDVTVRAGGRVSFEGKRDLIRSVVARAVVSPGRGLGRIDVQGRGTLLGE